jgi:hypothetical protein
LVGKDHQRSQFVTGHGGMGVSRATVYRALGGDDAMAT